MIGCGIGLTPMGGTTAMTRAGFVQRMLAISTNSCTFLWASKSGDTNTSTTDDTNARTITWDADVSGRITAQGTNSIQTFDGIANRGSAPDTLSLSFGNGVTDLPFSLVALVNVTDTAVARTIIAKWDNGAGETEWDLAITAADKLTLLLRDKSAAVNTSRLSDAVITQGALHVLASTYDGTGGATAADGMVLYQDRAVIASTPTNDAAYVAMENLTAPATVGSLDVATGQFFQGSQGFVRIDTVALTLAQINEICDLANAYYGLSL